MSYLRIKPRFCRSSRSAIAASILGNKQGQIWPLLRFTKLYMFVPLWGEQKYVQRFVALENAEMHREEPPLLGFVDGKQLFDRLFLPAKKAEIETVRNGKCDECCVQQKDSDMYEKNYDLCDVHIF